MELEDDGEKHFSPFHYLFFHNQKEEKNPYFFLSYSYRGCLAFEQAIP